MLILYWLFDGCVFESGVSVMCMTMKCALVGGFRIGLC